MNRTRRRGRSCEDFSNILGEAEKGKVEQKEQTDKQEDEHEEEKGGSRGGSRKQM